MSYCSVSSFYGEEQEKGFMKPQNGLQDIPDGAMTALITPMTNAGEIDWDGLAGLVDFQGFPQ